jgi:hypothetical protein
VYDSKAVDGEDSATIPIVVTPGETAKPIYARVRTTGGAVHKDWTQVGTSSGTGEQTFDLTSVSRSSLRLVVDVAYGAGLFVTSSREFMVGHVLAFWGQSLLARGHSSTYDGASQPTLPSSIDGKIWVSTRNDDAENTASVVQFGVSDTPVTGQTGAISAMADMLHTIAPNDFFSVRIHAVGGTDFADLVDDANAVRSFAKDKSVHDGAGGSTGGLVVFDWTYGPATNADDFIDRFCEVLTGNSADGTTAGSSLTGGGDLDHDLTELYGDYTGYKVGYSALKYWGDTDGDDPMGSSLRNNDTTLSQRSIQTEALQIAIRDIHNQTAISGFAVPFLPSSSPVLVDGANTDYVHYAQGDADGIQRYYRVLAKHAAERLGLRSGLGPVEFTDATWDFGASTVTLSARDADGSPVDVTTLRQILSESLPSGNPIARGFEFVDFNDIGTLTGVDFLRNREDPTSVAITSGSVVLGIPTISGVPDHRYAVVFGGGRGASGVRDSSDNYTDEVWKDVVVVADAAGGIEGTPVTPYPLPQTLRPYSQEEGLLRAFGDDSFWSDTSTGTLTISSGVLTFANSGVNTAKAELPLLDSALIAQDKDGSFTITFDSTTTDRLRIWIEKAGDVGSRVFVYDSDTDGAPGTDTVTDSIPVGFQNIGGTTADRWQLIIQSFVDGGSTTIENVRVNWTA